jgi:hypothetical protein
MGTKLTFTIEYPSDDAISDDLSADIDKPMAIVGLQPKDLTDKQWGFYWYIVGIVQPTYSASPFEINHGDCFGMELNKIIIELNKVKLDYEGFDFSIWLDSYEHENGLVGLDYDFFYKDSWHTKQFYNAVKGSCMFRFLRHNGFAMTNECGDFFRFAGSHSQAQVISDYIRQEIRPYIKRIASALKVDTDRIPYEVEIKKQSQEIYAVCFDFSQLEDDE